MAKALWKSCVTNKRKNNLLHLKPEKFKNRKEKK